MAGLAPTQVFEWPGAREFKGSRVGGLSALLCEGEAVFALSDDRGKLGPLRIYELKWLNSMRSELTLVRVVALAISPKVHVDFEGLARGENGEFLISTEGDGDRKPRLPPEILRVSSDGQFLGTIAVPKRFLPNPSGRQTKGVFNNRGFEGLSRWGDQLAVNTESSLSEKNNSEIPFVFYRKAGSVWSVEGEKIWKLHRPDDPGSSGEVFRGVSENLLASDAILIVERAVKVGAAGLSFQIQIFRQQLSFKGGGVEVLNWDREFEFKGKKQPVRNIEGLCLFDEKKILLVSDNNLEKNTPTQFVVLEFKP